MLDDSNLTIMEIATSLRSCLTKATQAAVRCSCRAMKRGSVKRPRKPKPTCRHTTGDSRETTGSLEQHLPEREQVALFRAESLISEVKKRRNYEASIKNCHISGTHAASSVRLVRSTR